jgi:hypothetical protein
MVDPTQTVQLDVSQFIAALRDIAFVVGLSVMGWKARTVAQPVYNFFTRADKHMDRVEIGLSNMEKGMQILLENHMTHVQNSLEILAKDKQNGETTDRMV